MAEWPNSTISYERARSLQGLMQKRCFCLFSGADQSTMSSVLISSVPGSIAFILFLLDYWFLQFCNSNMYEQVPSPHLVLVLKIKIMFNEYMSIKAMTADLPHSTKYVENSQFTFILQKCWQLGVDPSLCLTKSPSQKH